MGIDRATAAAALPDVPREDVAMPELGGAVCVRGLMLRDRMTLIATLRNDEGQSYASLARLLHLAVVGPDDKPLLTETEWERFGGAHFDAALRLFSVAKRLSGLDAEVVEKN